MQSLAACYIAALVTRLGTALAIAHLAVWSILHRDPSW